ncbi:hypothetical protein CK203_031438 [Vitis vinifera]|uniref:Uncharacterized protein n=1 Tax=Vitis vinifera TaxID=29760 RepID=A0A438I8X9_VITVI|nr:hypothetical protein CK203_031438 [Vitis vinifera]
MWGDLSTNLELLGNASAADEILRSQLLPLSQKVNSMESVMLYQKRIPSKFIFSCNWSARLQRFWKLGKQYSAKNKHGLCSCIGRRV